MFKNFSRFQKSFSQNEFSVPFVHIKLDFFFLLEGESEDES